MNEYEDLVISLKRQIQQRLRYLCSHEEETVEMSVLPDFLQDLSHDGYPEELGEKIEENFTSIFDECVNSIVK